MADSTNDSHVIPSSTKSTDRELSQHTVTADQSTNTSTWGFLSSITSGFKKVGNTLIRPFDIWDVTPENLAEKLDILDHQWGIDPSKVNGVEKMKFWPNQDAVSFIHLESWKKYIILANPRRILPLKWASKIVWHIKIFGVDYLEYENSYFIPINQRCMCDIHGSIFISNYKYIDPSVLIVNGEECIKTVYDYGDTVREVFTLINKTWHRIPGFNFTVEKIDWVFDVLVLQQKTDDSLYYFYADKNILQKRKNTIDTAHHHAYINQMLIFTVFAKKYTLWSDGERIPLSDETLIQDMLIDNNKIQILQSV